MKLGSLYCEDSLRNASTLVKGTNKYHVVGTETLSAGATRVGRYCWKN